MPTYEEIIDGLLEILHGVNYQGSLLDEEIKQMTELENAYFILQQMDK